MPVPSWTSARWRPSPFLQLSAVVHLVAAAGVLLAPAQWPWWLGALAVNHGLITAAGLLPRCHWLGPNLTRLPPSAAARGEVALTFDDGPDPAVTPRVLDLLDQAGMRATFFCIGERVLAHPALAREIVRRGHHIENHTQHHPHGFSLYGPRRMAREVEQAQCTLAQASGRAPRYVRAVAGLRNLFLQPILARHGLKLVAWTRRGYDTRDADPARVLARLSHQMAAGDILLLHDGHAGRTAEGQPLVLAVLPSLLTTLRGRGLRSVTLDAACAPAAAPALQGVPA
ncbi:polysaccharide deacetylase family protein [Ottowia testudinis]|uniref:Polysaccharide deacetylase family protein n=1 Tax=Ottowia testudinis TaxID=2816950 RepID=A0A975CC72_9BURK|nr:polysaccharide deacetylase family protein [Ottowia testudinis]QTD43700.1 polysaccharide deacetylase family protein [Ottowia testudinis]